MIQKIEHTAIIANEMDKSIEFYTEKLGFKLRLRGSGPKRENAFLYLEGQPDMEIELIRDLEPIEKYHKSGLVNHLAFTVTDIDEAIQYYRDQGIEFTTVEPNPTLDGGRMILFHGPNGELLQFIERFKK